MERTDDGIGTHPPSEAQKVEQYFMIALGTLGLGVLMIGFAIPGLLPGLWQSISGTQPKFFWYFSRATAIISYLVLWLSLVFGLLLSGKTAKFFPGAFTANEVHQFLSTFGLATGLFHGLLLMGDQYIHYSFAQVLLPFSSLNYRPVWVGVGQAAFYLWLLLVASFYVRKWIGYKTWRTVHFLGYLAFAGVMVHGITAGTDAGSAWMQSIYWFSGASILFLTFYRVFAVISPKPLQPVKVPVDNRME
jgi:predicted ferric reductase